jgi:hypothetical protein
MTACRASARRPAASVRRPSPRSWSSASKTRGCAFSISSKSTTQKGCRAARGELAVGLAGVAEQAGDRGGSPNSLMSKRSRRSGLPKSSRGPGPWRSRSCRRPWGPRRGRWPGACPGSQRPCCIAPPGPPRRSTASGWPGDVARRARADLVARPAPADGSRMKSGQARRCRWSVAHVAGRRSAARRGRRGRCRARRPVEHGAQEPHGLAREGLVGLKALA